MRVERVALVAVAIASTVTGCRDSNEPLAATQSLAAVSATQQAGTVGADAASPPRVIVRDAAGNPVAGVRVSFTGRQRFDSLESTVLATTSDDGTASIRWILPTRPGIATMVARAGSLPEIRFTATVGHGPVVWIAAKSAQHQAALPGATLPENPIVIVGDQFRNGVSGLRVDFIVNGPAAARIQATSAVTNDSGVASAGAWTLGTEPGVYVVSAELAGERVGLVFTARVNVPFTVSHIAGGPDACAISTGGETYCWGGVDLGSFTPSTIPVRISNIPRLASLTVGFGHACGLTSAGAAYCWGPVGSPKLGLADDLREVGPVQGGLTFTQIAAGGEFTCGLAIDHRVYCWGANARGQLGVGNSGTAYVRRPTAIASADTFMAVAAGYRHACALTTAGKTLCWGENTKGQLGAGTSEICVAADYDTDYDPQQVSCSSRPLLAATGAPFSALSSAGLSTCGLTNEGEAVCWGGAASSPAGVPSPVRFSRVVATNDGFCGLTETGKVYCAPFGGVPAIVSAPALSAIAAGDQWPLSRGSGYTCGIGRDDGYAYCWGANAGGQLGNGTFAASTIPLPVARPSTPGEP